MVLLDACFNGSFHKEKYIAASYLFSKGNTVVVQANSVNALQDKWATQLMGTLALGTKAGEWSAMVNYLETHIFGDPTYSFVPENNNLNYTTNRNQAKHWLTELKSSNAARQAMALRMLYKLQQPQLSELLIKEYKSNRNGIVRMECLKLLTNYNDKNFIECLKLAINDSYELVQRQAMYLSGKNGSPELLPTLIEAGINNQLSKRVAFIHKTSLTLFDSTEVLNELNRQFSKANYHIHPKERKQQLETQLQKLSTKWAEDLSLLNDSTVSFRHKKFAIRALRNYNYHPATDMLCEMAIKSTSQELRIILLEALGWFNLSYKKNKITETCRIIAGNGQEPLEIRNEAIKTLKRLETPWER